MRILLAEDDFATRKFMAGFLSKYGECDVTVDGMEAVDAFIMALEDGEPYDLVCLDIMMPVMDGYQALVGIRNLEKQRNIPEDKAVTGRWHLNWGVPFIPASPSTRRGLSRQCGN